MNAFIELSRKGATVLLLHHVGKDSNKNYTGAVEIEAAPDIAYRVDRGRLFTVLVALVAAVLALAVAIYAQVVK